MFSRPTGGRAYRAGRSGSLLWNVTAATVEAVTLEHTNAMTTSADVPRSATLLPAASPRPARVRHRGRRAPGRQLEEATRRRRSRLRRRTLLRANWVVVSWVLRAARARWLTGPILWATCRFVPSARSAPSSTDAGRAVSYGAQSAAVVFPDRARVPRRERPGGGLRPRRVVGGRPTPPPRGGGWYLGRTNAAGRGGGAGHAHEGWGGVGKLERSLASDLLRRHDSRARGVAERDDGYYLVSRAAGGSAPATPSRRARSRRNARATRTRTCFSRSRGSGS